MKSSDPASLNDVVTVYFNKLCLEGKGTSIARLVFHGSMHKHGPFNTESACSAGQRALAIFLCDAPETSVDPWTEEAAAAVADGPVGNDVAGKGCSTLTALMVMALAVQLDLGGRPRRACAPSEEHVPEPQGLIGPSRSGRSQLPTMK